MGDPHKNVFFAVDGGNAISSSKPLGFLTKEPDPSRCLPGRHGRDWNEGMARLKRLPPQAGARRRVVCKNAIAVFGLDRAHSSRHFEADVF